MSASRGYWNRLVGNPVQTVSTCNEGKEGLEKQMNIITINIPVSLTGEWLHILVHFLRAFKQDDGGNATSATNLSGNSSSLLLGIDLAQYRLNGVGYYWLAATTISYTFYLGIGGFLHVSNSGSGSCLL